MVDLKAVLAILLNVVSSIGVILTNKWVFVVYGFHFGTALTCLHFTVTFIGLAICAWAGIFEPKVLPLWKVFPLSLSFAAFVVFTNLSLQLNSVSFYQVSKIMTTPTILVLLWNFYDKTFSAKVIGSLALAGTGVVVTWMTALEVHPLGALYAFLGVVSASLYQIWIGTEQKRLEASSMQLLLYQAPLSAATLILFIPLLEDPFEMVEFPFTSGSVFAILLSGVLAFSVNLSTYLVIGNTSAITYNVVGYFKFCVVIVMGFILFQDPMTSRNMLGIGVTMAGVLAYTVAKTIETNEEKERKDKEEAGKSDTKESTAPVNEAKSDGDSSAQPKEVAAAPVTGKSGPVSRQTSSKVATGSRLSSPSPGEKGED